MSFKHPPSIATCLSAIYDIYRKAVLALKLDKDALHKYSSCAFAPRKTPPPGSIGLAKFNTAVFLSHDTVFSASINVRLSSKCTFEESLGCFCDSHKLMCFELLSG